MQFQLFLLFFLPFHQFFIITTALFNYNQTNSSHNIKLHQCDTNKSIVHSTIITTTDKRFDSCDLNCCTKNDSNQITLVNSTICQVTVQSLRDVCLGRLCYSGICDQFLLSMNKTYNQPMTKNSIIINPIRSSLSPIPWSSLVNSTRLTWSLWKDKNTLSIRYSILILLLIVNLSLTLITLFIVIKSIRHAKLIAERKLRHYSLF